MPASRLLALLPVCFLLATTGCFTTKPAKVCMQGNLTAKTIIANDFNVRQVSARSLPGEPRCANCRVALIDVDGILVNRNLAGSGSLGENPVALFREKLRVAEADPCVVAIVVRINSPGGGVTASDIMRQELVRFRQRSAKPVVACLMDLGAGGAYYLASASDMIIAHPTTLTGGLGVILNVYDLTDAMSQQNVFNDSIRAGEKIDMGSPARTLDDDERDILEEIADKYHARLRGAVIEARPSLVVREPETLPPPSDNEDNSDASESESDDETSASDDEEDWEGSIFDGRVMIATEAAEHGLVDQIGYLDDALATARGLAGVATAKTIIYRRNNDRAITPYDITPNLPAPMLSIPFSVPGLDRSNLPTFLYMWQPEPAMERTGGA